MTTFKNGCAVAALALALPLASMSSTQAAPLAAGTAFSAPVAAAAVTDNSLMTQVQWRGRRGGGWGGRGAGVGIGIGAGLLLGGIAAAAAAPRYYGPSYGYGYSYGPTYYAPPPAPVIVEPSYGYVGGDAEAYCMQRYRSYDPASGTYLNYDGNRYPCP